MLSQSTTPARHVLSLVFALLLSRVVHAQDTLTNVASWTSPRADLVQDYVYIDGGSLFVGNYDDGTWLDLESVNHQGSMLYKLGLRSAFENLQSMSDLEQVSYTDNPDYIYYVGGAMFVNDGNFLTYGGLASSESTGNGMFTNSNSSAHTSSSVLDPIVSVKDLQPLVSEDPSMWYRCCGAHASAPSENIAFYVSGLQAENGGPIRYRTRERDADHPSNLADDVVMCDLKEADQPRCERLALPVNIPSRAEAEVVWVPFGSKGSLVLIGGIQMPADMSVSGIFPNETYENDFMRQIAVFDIATRQWGIQSILQDTAPTQRASFCTAVATAQDGKSHHIYVYGGYDGTYNDSHSKAYDETWVLSLPAFQWTLLHAGTDSHRRQNHKCVKVSPSQFVSIGGNIEYGLSLAEPGFVDVFDMNLGNWTDSYNPKYWNEYEIPTAVQQRIGGRMINTVPDDLTDFVKKLYKTPYAGKVRKMQQYVDLSLKDMAQQWGFRWWHITVFTVLAYLVLSSIAVIVVVVLRRRMLYRSANIDMSEMKSRNQLIRWMHNAPVKEPSPHHGKARAISSPPLDSKLMAEGYFDEERSAHVTTRVDVKSQAKAKSTGVHVGIYERMDVGTSEEIELRTFTDSSKVRTP